MDSALLLDPVATRSDLPSGKTETPADVVGDFIDIVARLGLNDITVAAVAGLAPHTVRVVRLGRTLPNHARCRAAIAEFVLRNRNALSRADLRLCVGRPAQVSG